MKEVEHIHPAGLNTSYDVAGIRRDFPVILHPLNGKPFIYLDNAATAQKPRAVVDAIARFYAQEYASVHRSNYLLGERATEAFESARQKIRRFIAAASPG